MKKTLLMVLAAIGLAGFSRAEITADTSWYSEGGTAFTISDEADLVGFAELVNGGTTFEGATITLADNITLTEAWPGIGVHSKTRGQGKPFKGVFDGNNKTIAGLKFENKNYNGFFNQVDGATIKDLTLAGDIVLTSGGGAFFAGSSHGATFENCTAKGSFVATHNLGGIVTYLSSDSTLRNCVNNADLSNSEADGTKVGGMAASCENNTTAGSKLLNCVNNGALAFTAESVTTTEGGLGGLVGYAHHNANGGYLTIEGCSNTGTFSAPQGARVGQLVGGLYCTAVINGTNTGTADTLALGCNSRAELTFATVKDGVATYTATLEPDNTYLVTAEGAKPVISLTAGQSITFDTSLTTIDASAITADTELMTTEEGKQTTYTAAVAKVNETLYADFTTALAKANDGDTLTLLTAVELDASFFAAVEKGVKITCAKGVTVTAPTGYLWEDGVLTVVTKWSQLAETTWYGDGTAETFTIATAEQLAGLAKLVNAGNNFAEKTITLSENIDLAGLAWAPIGSATANPFAGTFDGDGKTISNLTITGNINFAGLFGRVGYNEGSGPAGTVKNVTIHNATIEGNYYTAVVVGVAQIATIDNCDVTGTITISTLNYGVGGVVGQGNATIRNCDIVGTIKIVPGSAYVGGIAGYGYFTIDNCHVDGTDATVSSISVPSSYVGGIQGFTGEDDANKRMISNCSVKNLSITGVDTTGGIVGMSHHGVVLMNCAVDGLTLATTGTDGTIGAVAGTVNGKAEAPSKLYNCTMANTTVNGATATTLTSALTSGAAANDNYFIGSDVELDENNKVLSGNFTVFNADIKDAILASGATAVDNGDGTWTVMMPVATIGKGDAIQYFSTLQTAIDAAGDGDIVNVIANFELSATVDFLNKTLTLEGNNYTISGKGIPVKSGKIIGFNVNGGAVTIQNMTLTGFDNDSKCNGGSIIQMGVSKTTDLTAKNLDMSFFARDAFTLYEGTFLIEGCNIDCAFSEGRTALSKGFQIGNPAKATSVSGKIVDTTIINSDSTYEKWESSAIELYAGASVVLDGCEISNSSNGIYIDNYMNVAYPATYKAGDVSAIIKNTTINDADFAVFVQSAVGQTAKATVSIESGNYTGYAGWIFEYNPTTGANSAIAETDVASFNVSGGTFSIPVPQEACADGFTLEAITDENGTVLHYTVKRVKVAISTNADGTETRYETFNDVAKLDEGTKVTLVVAPTEAEAEEAKIEIVSSTKGGETTFTPEQAVEAADVLGATFTVEKITEGEGEDAIVKTVLAYDYEFGVAQTTVAKDPANPTEGLKFLVIAQIDDGLGARTLDKRTLEVTIDTRKDGTIIDTETTQVSDPVFDTNGRCHVYFPINVLTSGAAHDVNIKLVK